MSVSAILSHVALETDVHPKNRNKKLIEIFARHEDSGLSDEQRKTKIEAKIVPVINHAPSSLLNQWAAKFDIHKPLFAAAANPAHSAYGLAIAAQEAFRNTSESLDLSDADNQQMVDGLKQAGIFPSDPDSVADLYARVTAHISPAVDEGLPPDIKLGWVIAARTTA